uniref:SCP domain-containing protein n=1 Tax=Caenorhabditis tropicalis TaxID=1561998 RepID=A0A1I7UX41_9PELO
MTNYQTSVLLQGGYSRHATVPLFQSNSTQKYDGYWINGRRTSNCLYSNQTGPECQGIKAFNITDPLLSTTDWYQWGAGQPDFGYYPFVGGSECVAYRVSSDGGAGIDDLVCGANSASNVSLKGFVCGMHPDELLP